MFLGGDRDRKKSAYFEKEKRDIDFCEICLKPFKQLVHRKHKCKRCKRYICSQCGQNKTIVLFFLFLLKLNDFQILGIDMEKETPHRTCDLCIFDQFFIHEFTQIHKIYWNFTSLIGERWVKFVNIEKYLKIRKLYHYFFHNTKKICAFI